MIRKLSSMAVFSIIGTICTFFFQTIITHLLDTYNYGVFASWMTDISYLGVFFVLGLDSSLLYHSKLGEKHEDNIGKNITVYFLVAVVAFLIVLIFNLNFNYYASLIISIFSLAVTSVVASYFLYKEDYIKYNILINLRPYLNLLFFLLIFLMGLLINLTNTLYIYTFISVVILILVLFFYYKESTIKFNKDIFSSWPYFSFGLKNVINKVLSLTLYASTIYCLEFFVGYNELAFFFVASSISKIVWVLPDSAGNILYPRFLKIGNVYTKKDVFNEMFYYARIIFLLNIIIVISFYFLGNFFIKLLYNESYYRILIPTIILLIGNQGMVYYKILSRYLASINKWAPLYYSLFIGVVSNITLNYLLFKILDDKLIGASIATSISFFICGFILSFFVKGSTVNFLNINKLLFKNK